MKTIIETVNTSVQAFVKDEDGAVMIEYVLIAVLIAVALIGSLTALKTDIAAVFTTIMTAI